MMGDMKIRSWEDNDKMRKMKMKIKIKDKSRDKIKQNEFEGSISYYYTLYFFSVSLYGSTYFKI